MIEFVQCPDTPFEQPKHLSETTLFLLSLCSRRGQIGGSRRTPNGPPDNRLDHTLSLWPRMPPRTSLAFFMIPPPSLPIQVGRLAEFCLRKATTFCTTPSSMPAPFSDCTSFWES